MAKVYVTFKDDGTTLSTISKLPKAGRTELDDTDARVVAVRDRQAKSRSGEGRVDLAKHNDPLMAALVKEVAAARGITVQAMWARLKAEVRGS